jgi:NADPH:quinone reductase-like Zn-dependent oxidoreductase
VRATFFQGKDHPIIVSEVSKPQPTGEQVLVRMKWAALNHLDIWIRREQTLGDGRKVTLGADGSGVVESVGESADQSIIGKEVIINPSLDWGNNPVVQGDNYRILGFPDNGTFADYLLTSKKYVHPKPDHLTPEEAAAIPLAGLTAYRALFTKARLRPGERILITGIGGGAALFALQMAVAFQAKVYVTSSSNEKIARAMTLGAVAGFNYTDPQWIQKAKKELRGFDVIVDSAGGPQFTSLLDLAMPGGRVVLFGRTRGDIPSIPPRLIYWKQLNILGTSMGTRDEFFSMIDYLEKKNIHPIIDRQFPLEEVDNALAYMERGNHVGKIMLKIS